MNSPSHFPDKVWYIAFGSNLCEERFLRYILGTTRPPKPVPGCRDKTLPAKQYRVRLPHPMQFLGKSRSWGGGTAYLDVKRSGEAVGRAYLVTWEQFRDILTQETVSFSPLQVELVNREYKIVKQQPIFDAIAHVGDIEGFQALTLAISDFDEWKPTQPTAAYMDMVTNGWKECDALTEAELVQPQYDLA